MQRIALATVASILAWLCGLIVLLRISEVSEPPMLSITVSCIAQLCAIAYLPKGRSGVSTVALVIIGQAVGWIICPDFEARVPLIDRVFIVSRTQFGGVLVALFGGYAGGVIGMSANVAIQIRRLEGLSRNRQG